MPSIVRFKYGWLNLDSVTEIEDKGQFMRAHFRDDSEPRTWIDADEMNHLRRCLENFRVDNHAAPARTRQDITPIRRDHFDLPFVADAACCEPGECRSHRTPGDVRRAVGAFQVREDDGEAEGGAA
jgi:hypothetical protein